MYFCVYHGTDLSKKEAETKILSEKLQVANSKLFESRNKIQQLQQELKNVHKVTSKILF